MNQQEKAKQFEKGFKTRLGGVSDAVSNVKNFFSTDKSKDANKHVVSALIDRKKKALEK